MAETIPEKSRGLKFAEQQLLRHGWEKGKGLGRVENGISEAIKVKVKCDKGGVGHREGEQFTFHWWDHVFNKASSSLAVESGQDGVMVKKVAGEEDEEGMISNKKPRKASLAKAMLYGSFVKSATLLSGQEQPEEKPSSSDDGSSSEDEDQRLDLSTTTKLSDADLVKACGGRTAHKGARHGLTMSAKLARLEQQEQEFLAKYSKKSQPAVTACSEPISRTTGRSPAVEQDSTKKPKRKKAKKTKSSSNDLPEDVIDQDEANANANATVPESNNSDEDRKSKKKKKRHSKESESLATGETQEICAGNNETDYVPKKNKKHSKRNAPEAHENLNPIVGENAAEPKESESSEACEVATAEEMGESGTHQQRNLNNSSKKKKKNKSPKNKEEVATSMEVELSNNTESNKVDTSSKKEMATDVLEQDGEERTEEKTKMKKRKRCKQEKEKLEDVTQDESIRVKKGKRMKRMKLHQISRERRNKVV